MLPGRRYQALVVSCKMEKCNIILNDVTLSLFPKMLSNVIVMSL